MSGRVTQRKTVSVGFEAWRRREEMWTWFYDATDEAVDAWNARPRVGDVRPGPTNVVTFKPRDHFRADGMPKAWYSEEAALERASLTPGMRAYRCSVCQGWHVGHRVRTRRRPLGTSTAVAC